MTDALPATHIAPTPIEQLLFHVRLIDPWHVAVARGAASPPTRWSFFGLELALHGRRSNVEEEITETLDFSASAQPQQRAMLCTVTGPFTVVVQSKMPLEIATDQQRTLLQSLVPVQIHNTLARLNKIHFLRHCTTGGDVYEALAHVLETVSIAKPLELTILRHNHAQAAAKIGPFAARADVQQAQVAQFQKLQLDEAKWPADRKRRKQCVLQQLDFCREHYLYDHIGAQLQGLHEEIMGRGQWHAYEFEKALWYYHAPTGELYAEHPMRINETTRQLIGSAQLRTRIAARQLQHGIRRFLHLNGVIKNVIERLMQVLGEEIVETAFEAVCDAGRAAPFVDVFKANSGKASKARRRWSEWFHRVILASKPTPVNVPALPNRSEEQDKMAQEVSTRVLESTCDELLASLLHSAWDAHVAEVYVGHLHANATNAAKAKRLWETWHQHGVATSQTKQQQDELADQVVERVLDTICDEQLSASTRLAWDASVAALYVGHLKANSSKAAKARKLWETWSRIAIVEPPRPPLVELEPGTITALPVTSPAPTPPNDSTLAAVSTDLSFPIVTDPEPAIVDENREVVVQPEPPTLTRTIPLDAEDEDSDGDAEIRNWRSRLRLLKQHQRTRRKSPSKAHPKPHSSVVAPQSSTGPLLLDRSTHLGDAPSDGPSSGVTASLRESRRTVVVVDDDLDDSAVTSSSSSSSSLWRRDGSFRSLHAFLHSPSSMASSSLSPDGPTVFPPALGKYARPDKDAPAPVFTLPVVLRTAHTSMSPPSPAFIKPHGPHGEPYTSSIVAKPTAYSLPKKLPYIRPRKPRNS